MRRWVWVGGAVVAGVAAAAWLLRRPLRGRLVALIGDSHAQGLAPTVRRLVEERGGRVRVDAVSGVSTAQFAASGRARAARDADYVLVVLGTNDGAAVGAGVRDVLQQVGPRPRVYWWGPPAMPRPDLVELAATALDRIGPDVRAAGGRYLDSRPLTRDLPFSARGVHLTAAGYAAWAGRALRAFR